MFSRCPNLPASDSPWTLTNSGLTALRAQAVAVGSRGGSKAIFAGLSGGGIVTSINNGATWQDTPENAASVRGIATDPITPSTVYAATGKGVIRSLSGGNSCPGEHRTADGQLSGSTTRRLQAGARVYRPTINHAVRRCGASSGA
jgi:hypothetical protein